MDDITKTLTQIAISKAILFCYGCYSRAPAGRCTHCYSDDLMYEMPGIGVEFGSEWLLRGILSAHLTAADTLEAFEQSVTECYPETVKIGWIEYDTASALKELDPVSWNIAHSEWLDEESSDGNLLTFDNGSTYYWASDLEGMIKEFETKSTATSS